MTLRVSDHALLRFLERAGGLDAEALRASIAAGLERGFRAAKRIGLKDGEVHIRADGLVYVIRDDTVVTIRPDGPRRR